MQLQVALDRMTVAAALATARAVAPYADWVEVGTSLIKEFGMDIVRRVRTAVPDRLLLADIKTNDNAAYEFALCFAAGADAATVMGTAPRPTITTCLHVAAEHDALAVIDLLGTDEEQQRRLLELPGAEHAVLAVHVGKDTQEAGAPGTRQLPGWAAHRRVAVAGGITLDEVAGLGRRYPAATLVVGTTVTGADDPGRAARAFADAMAPYAVGGRSPR